MSSNITIRLLVILAVQLICNACDRNQSDLLNQKLPTHAAARYETITEGPVQPVSLEKPSEPIQPKQDLQQAINQNRPSFLGMQPGMGPGMASGMGLGMPPGRPPGPPPFPPEPAPTDDDLLPGDPFGPPDGIVVPVGYCGNSRVDIGVGEECDDGNLINGDGCNSICMFEHCGNSILDQGEQCDDGNNDNGDGCSQRCEFEVCGNAILDLNAKILDLNEECDDGNLIPGDGCAPTCRYELCGNAIVDPGEECDLGGKNGPTTICSVSCKRNICGDGYITPGEECDPGRPDGNCCSATCKLQNCTCASGTATCM